MCNKCLKTKNIMEGNLTWLKLFYHWGNYWLHKERCITWQMTIFHSTSNCSFTVRHLNAIHNHNLESELSFKYELMVLSTIHRGSLTRRKLLPQLPCKMPPSMMYLRRCFLELIPLINTSNDIFSKNVHRKILRVFIFYLVNVANNMYCDQ